MKIKITKKKKNESVRILYFAYYFCLENETQKQTAKCNIHHHHNYNIALQYGRESVHQKINRTKALFWKLEEKFCTHGTSLQRV